MKTRSRRRVPHGTSNLRSRVARALGPSVVLFACSVAALPACSVFGPSGPTPVAQGKYFASGNAEYDEFFLELYRTQVAMAEAPQRFTSAHQELASGLGLAKDLPRDAVIEHVRARSRELSTGGRIMQLKLSEAQADKAATAVLLTRPAARDDALRTFAEPVERSSNELVSLRADLERILARCSALEARQAELHQRTQAVFVRDGVAKVNEVERNLEDASRVLAYMRDQAERQLTETRALLDGLAAATDTSDGAFDRPEPPPPEAEPERVATPSKSKSKSQGTRTTTTAPAKPKASPAPKAAATPKPAPAPRPAPSEPAGFEP